jgi:hypothetical protein
LPNDTELRKEFDLKHLNDRDYPDVIGLPDINCWSTWKNAKLAVLRGKIERLSYDNFNSISRLTNGSSLQMMQDISLYYSDYVRDPFRIARGFENNDAIPMAMVIEHYGQRVLTAGNTRLNAAKICGVEPYPKILVIPGEV